MARTETSDYACVSFHDYASGGDNVGNKLYKIPHTTTCERKRGMAGPPAMIPVRGGDDGTV